MNRKIIINENEINYLLNNTQGSLHDLILNAFKKNKIITKKNSKNKYELNLTIQDINEILDQLTYLLTFKGMDANGNINEQGVFIDRLIDLIN